MEVLEAGQTCRSGSNSAVQLGAPWGSHYMQSHLCDPANERPNLAAAGSFRCGVEKPPCASCKVKIVKPPSALQLLYQLINVLCLLLRPASLRQRERKTLGACTETSGALRTTARFL